VARAKLSPVSVDNSAEKISGVANFRCFQPVSQGCLFFGRFVKPLILGQRFSYAWQIPEIPDEL
jgi:hypothetical protein